MNNVYNMEGKNTIAYLGLGSNIGDRESNLNSAIMLLGQANGIEIIKVSSYYETSPVGYINQPDFINAVAKICTSLEPHSLLDVCMQIERKLKRVRDFKWGPRTIDIDILLVGDIILSDKELTIPHPRMHERDFVLKPLCEISPNTIHPVLKKTIRQIVMENNNLIKRKEAE